MSFNFKDWVSIIIMLLIISIVNPLNTNIIGTLILSFFFLTHFLLFKLFTTFISQQEIVKGIFDGFILLCCVQFILAICFPLLGMLSVTNLFFVGGEEWATRVGSRSGAIGTFSHPGALALFTMIASSFFLSCFLKNFKSKLSIAMLTINAATLILTYSRTSYLAFIIALFFIIYINKNAGKSFLSITNFFKFILPVTLVLIWLIFYSPLSDQFLKSDSTEQYDNRLVHFFLAYSIFLKSPVFGVGLNTHLAYLAENYSMLVPITTNEFFSSNPIHNIHLIVLSETGLIGLACWFRFIIITIKAAKKQIYLKSNEILSLSLIGINVGYILYGLTGWTPFSSIILPYFLFFNYLAIHFRIKSSGRKKVEKKLVPTFE